MILLNVLSVFLIVHVDQKNVIVQFSLPVHLMNYFLSILSFVSFENQGLIIAFVDLYRWLLLLNIINIIVTDKTYNRS